MATTIYPPPYVVPEPKGERQSGVNDQPPVPARGLEGSIGELVPELKLCYLYQDGADWRYRARLDLFPDASQLRVGMPVRFDVDEKGFVTAVSLRR